MDIINLLRKLADELEKIESTKDLGNVSDKKSSDESPDEPSQVETYLANKWNI